MRFYLGTHEEAWLTRDGFEGIPLFVSVKRFIRRQRRAPWPAARTRWALDSGAFTELARHGRHVTPAAEYAEWIERLDAEVGSLDWAAPQDWMVEPFMLEQTGLTIYEHQCRTVESVLELRRLVDVPVIPVLQGWTLDDYVRCVELYAEAGVELCDEPTVGVGSVCKRQDSFEIAAIMRTLAERGLALHGFGVKMEGVGLYATHLASADSLAWSDHYRKNPPLPGHSHKSCTNCAEGALRWRRSLLARGEQLAIY